MLSQPDVRSWEVSALLPMLELHFFVGVLVVCGV